MFIDIRSSFMYMSVRQCMVHYLVQHFYAIGFLLPITIANNRKEYSLIYRVLFISIKNAFAVTVVDWLVGWLAC